MTEPLNFGGLFSPRDEEEDPLAPLDSNEIGNDPVVPSPASLLELAGSAKTRQKEQGASLISGVFGDSFLEEARQKKAIVEQQTEDRSAMAELKTQKSLEENPYPEYESPTKEGLLQQTEEMGIKRQRLSSTRVRPQEGLIPVGVEPAGGNQAAIQRMENGLATSEDFESILQPFDLAQTRLPGFEWSKGMQMVENDLLQEILGGESVGFASPLDDHGFKFNVRPDTDPDDLDPTRGEFFVAAAIDANVRLARGFMEWAGWVPEGKARQQRLSYEVMKKAFLTERDDKGNIIETSKQRKLEALGLIAISNLIPLAPQAKVAQLGRLILGTKTAAKLGGKVLGKGIVSSRLGAAGGGALAGNLLGQGEAMGFPEEQRGAIVASSTAIGGLLGGGGAIATELGQSQQRRLGQRMQMETPRGAIIDLPTQVQLPKGKQLFSPENPRSGVIETMTDMREKISRGLFTDRRSTDVLVKNTMKEADRIERQIADGTIDLRDVLPGASIGTQRGIIPAGVPAPETLRTKAQYLQELSSQLDLNAKMAQSGIANDPRLYNPVSTQWEKAEIPVFENGQQVGTRLVKSMQKIFDVEEAKAYPDLIDDLGHYMAYRRFTGKYAKDLAMIADGVELKGAHLSRKTFDDAQEFLAALESKYPTPMDGRSLLDEMAMDLNDVSMLQLMNLKNINIIDGKQMANLMEEGADYIPFHRVRDVLSKNATRGSLSVAKDSPLAPLTKGLSDENPIKNPIEELFMQTAQINQMVNRQAARSSLIDLYEEVPHLFPASFKQRAGSNTKMGHITSDRVRSLDLENDKTIQKWQKKLGKLQAEKAGPISPSRLDSVNKEILSAESVIADAQDSSMKFFERLHRGEENAMKVFRTVDTPEGPEIRQLVFDADDNWLAAMDSMPPEMHGMAIRAAAGATRWLRAGALSVPEFIIKNLIRDQFTAGTASQNGLVPVVSSIVTMSQELAVKLGWKNEEWERWMREFSTSGVMQSTLIGSTSAGNISRASIQRGLSETLSTGTKAGKLLRGSKNFLKKEKAAKQLADTLRGGWDFLYSPVRMMEGISDGVEGLTRKAEFRLSRGSGARIITKKGIKDLATGGSLERKASRTTRQAALDAADVTLNFARSGRQARTWNKLEPFMNAKLQDLSKFGRLLENRETRLPTLTKAFAYYTIPALTSLAMFKDDPDYWDLDEEDRSNYLMVGKRSNGVFIKAPRPQGALALLFGQMMESIMGPMLLQDGAETQADAFTDMLTFTNDPRGGAILRKQAASQFLKDSPIGIAASAASAIPGVGGVMEAIGLPGDGGRGALMSAVPQILEPAIESTMNLDTFKGRPIESVADLKKPRHLRKRASTSKFAEKLSAMTFEGSPFDSPLKMQHMIDKYTAKIGGQVSRSLGTVGDPRTDPGTDQMGFGGDVVRGGAATPFAGTLRGTFFTKPQRDDENRVIFGMRGKKTQDLFELRDSAIETQKLIDEAISQEDFDEVTRLHLFSPEARYSKAINAQVNKITKILSKRREIQESPYLDEDAKYEISLTIDRSISMISDITMRVYIKEIVRQAAEDQLQLKEAGEFLANAPFYTPPDRGDQ